MVAPFAANVMVNGMFDRGNPGAIQNRNEYGLRYRKLLICLVAGARYFRENQRIIVR